MEPRESSAGQPASIRWIEDLDALRALAEEWERLESLSASELAPTWGPGFLLPWCRKARRPGESPLVGFLYEEGTLVGVAPLVRWRGTLGRVPLRRVDLAGHSAEAGGLLLPEDRPDLVGSLLGAVVRDYGPDVVVLAGSGGAARDAVSIREAARTLGVTVESVPFRHARADLTGGYEAYVARKGRHFRRVVKSVAARVEGAGTHRVEILRGPFGPEEAEALAARLAAVVDRNRGAAGHGPMPADERAFRRDLLESLGARRRALVALLTIGGRDAAYLIVAARGSLCVDLYIGYDHAMADLSPGAYLRHALMQRLPELGIKTVVSPGDYSYKERWATEFVTRERLFCFARTPRARLARLARFVVPRVLERARRTLACR